jgi:hypothetical protein
MLVRPTRRPAASLDARTSNNYFDALPGAPGEQSFVPGREFPRCCMASASRYASVIGWGPTMRLCRFTSPSTSETSSGQNRCAGCRVLLASASRASLGETARGEKAGSESDAHETGLHHRTGRPSPSVHCVRTRCARGCDAGGPATTRANRTFTSRSKTTSPFTIRGWGSKSFSYEFRSRFFLKQPIDSRSSVEPFR